MAANIFHIWNFECVKYGKGVPRIVFCISNERLTVKYNIRQYASHICHCTGHFHIKTDSKPQYVELMGNDKLIIRQKTILNI